MNATVQYVIHFLDNDDPIREAPDMITFPMKQAYRGDKVTYQAMMDVKAKLEGKPDAKSPLKRKRRKTGC